eukprot:3152642-Pleurochrysis_carterae.AAC.2
MARCTRQGQTPAHAAAARQTRTCSSPTSGAPPTAAARCTPAYRRGRDIANTSEVRCAPRNFAHALSKACRLGFNLYRVDAQKHKQLMRAQSVEGGSKLCHYFVLRNAAYTRLIWQQNRTRLGALFTCEVTPSAASGDELASRAPASSPMSRWRPTLANLLRAVSARVLDRKASPLLCARDASAAWTVAGAAVRSARAAACAAACAAAAAASVAASGFALAAEAERGESR